jgi:hypothetical protein
LRTPRCNSAIVEIDVVIHEYLHRNPACLMLGYPRRLLRFDFGHQVLMKEKLPGAHRGAPAGMRFGMRGALELLDAAGASV